MTEKNNVQKFLCSFLKLLLIRNYEWIFHFSTLEHCSVIAYSTTLTLIWRKIATWFQVDLRLKSSRFVTTWSTWVESKKIDWLRTLLISFAGMKKSAYSYFDFCFFIVLDTVSWCDPKSKPCCLLVRIALLQSIFQHFFGFKITNSV